MYSDSAEIKPAQCCIKLVFYLTYTTMHGNTKVKFTDFLDLNNRRRCQSIIQHLKRCLIKNANNYMYTVDKKNQLDVTFCILYLSSNSCSTCFGQPCAHLSVCLSVCLSIYLSIYLPTYLPIYPSIHPSIHPSILNYDARSTTHRQLLMMGTWLPETC